MRPMTIVVVREEPAGGSDAGASAFAGAADAVVAAGAADAVVAGAGAAVSGADAVVAGAAAAEAGAAGLAVVWAKPPDAARRSTARTAVSAERRFMAGKTIGRGRTRQAAGRAA
jgi:hypothetical protein